MNRARRALRVSAFGRHGACASPLPNSDIAGLNRTASNGTEWSRKAVARPGLFIAVPADSRTGRPQKKFRAVI